MPAAERDAVMMLSMSDDAMTTSTFMQRDPFRSVMDLQTTAAFANPDVFSRIGPGHRVSAALPGYIGIACDAPQLFVHVWIGRPSVGM